jgi:hypothetical protein
MTQAADRHRPAEDLWVITAYFKPRRLTSSSPAKTTSPAGNVKTA